MKPAFKDVCRKQECINLMQSTCEKVLPCGHPCCGFSGEKKCMPCLDPKCIDKMDPSKKINQNIVCKNLSLKKVEWSKNCF